MNTMRISFTEKDDLLKGSIGFSGDTSFIQSCLAEIVVKVAEKYGVSPDKVLQDVWQVILTEGAANVWNQDQPR